MNLISLLSAKRRLTKTGKSWTVNGLSNNLALNIGNQYNYGYNCVYQNGRTYLSIRQNHVSSNGRAGILEYYNENISHQIFNANPTGIDYHDEVTFQMDSTGIITIIHGQHVGQDDYNDVWKNSVPYDITSFAKQANAPNKSGNYPKFFRANDDSYFLIGRILRTTTPENEWDLNFTTYDGANWETPKTFVKVDAEVGIGVILYPFSMIGGSNNEWLYIRWAKRVGLDPTVLYRDHYFAKCHRSNINIWHNINETFSKDINAASITETEANTNFRFAINNADLAASGGGNFINSSGIIRQYNEIDSIDTLHHFDPTYSSFVSNIRPQHLINEKEKYIIDVENNVLGLYSTTAFTDKKLIQNIYEDQTNGLSRVNIPMNFEDIPKGQKFSIFVTTNKHPGDSIVDSPNNNDIVAIEMIK